MAGLHIVQDPAGQAADPNPTCPDGRLESPPEHHRTAWTADQLMAIDFPEPRWAVPGILPEGASLLAGPPKIGKSWLSLGLAVAVASGGRALGAIDVKAGDVLYLALEDTGRRLQTRLRKVLARDPAPASLTLATTCPPLPDGGAERIEEWLDHHRDSRLVIIDTFAKVRGRTAPSIAAYDADYTAMGRIKAIADAHQVAVLVVHHVRKADATDVFDTVSGTNGLTGAVDSTLVLGRTRGGADGVLHITGRDVEENDHALAFHPDLGAWQLLDGPADEHTLSTTSATILHYLRNNPPAAPKAIAEATGLSYDNTRQTCRRMADQGRVRSDTTGRYRTVDPEPHASDSPVTPDLSLMSPESLNPP